MIINSTADLQSAPEHIRQRFIQQLAAGVNRWHWVDGAWKIQHHTAALERFGLTLDDVPDAPTPDKPTYNPDERAREAKAREVREERDRLIAATDYAVQPDSPYDAPEIREYRQALRDVPQQKTFPADVTWPVKPGVLPE